MGSQLVLLLAFFAMSARSLLMLPQTFIRKGMRLRASKLRISSSTASHNESSDDGSQEVQLKKYSLQGKTSPESKSGVTVQTDTGHTIQTDLPLRMGGKNLAPQPVETLLAAWMGCTQATALFVGRQMKPERLALERLEFENIEAVRDERGALQLPVNESPKVPSRIQQVSGTILVFAAKAKAIKAAEMDILREQTEQRCPVANMMIASGCHMQVEWIDGNARR